MLAQSCAGSRIKLLCLCVLIPILHGIPRHIFPYDGWGNNEIHPEYGAANDPNGLQRTASFRTAGRESPGFGTINDIADRVFSSSRIPDPFGRNTLLAMFGKLIAHDMIDTSGIACPAEILALNQGAAATTSGKSVKASTAPSSTSDTGRRRRLTDQMSSLSGDTSFDVSKLIPSNCRVSTDSVSGIEKVVRLAGTDVSKGDISESPIWWRNNTADQFGLNCSWPAIQWPWSLNSTVPNMHQPLTPVESAELYLNVPLQPTLLRSSYVVDNADSSSTGPSALRRQLSKASAYLDASFLYGNSEIWASAIRTYQGGKLKMTTENTFPQNVVLPGHPGKFRLPLIDPLKIDDGEGDLSTQQAAGRVPGKMQPLTAQRKILETPHLLALQTVWARFHNHLANLLASENPTWNDSLLFTRARLLLKAVFQHIVIDEYLPALGINLRAYGGYQPNIDPSLSDAFVAAFRAIGHSQMSPLLMQLPPLASFEALKKVNNRTCLQLLVSQLDAASVPDGQLGATRLCELLMPASSNINKGSTTVKSDKSRLSGYYAINSKDVDSVLRGLMLQQQQYVGLQMVTDLRRFLFPVSTGALQTFNALTSESSATTLTTLEGKNVDGASATNASSRQVAFNVDPHSPFIRADLAALDIAASRDLGVGTYNEVRNAYKLSAAKLSDITKDEKLLARLRTVYGTDTSPIDFVVAGLAEDPTTASPLGPTFQAVLRQQFENGTIAYSSVHSLPLVVCSIVILTVFCFRLQCAMVTVSGTRTSMTPTIHRYGGNQNMLYGHVPGAWLTSYAQRRR
jgi:hypothetical protein